MKKLFKKIAFGSLCLAIGGFAYVANGFTTLAKFEVVDTKKAETTKTSNLTRDEVKNIRVFNMSDFINAVNQYLAQNPDANVTITTLEHVPTCITDEEQAKQTVTNYFKTRGLITPDGELKPEISYVYPAGGVTIPNVLKWDPILFSDDVNHSGAPNPDDIFYCDQGPLRIYNKCVDISGNPSEEAFDGYYYDPDYLQKVDKSTIQEVQHGWTFGKDTNGCITSVSFNTVVYAKCKQACTDTYSKIYTINYNLPTGVEHKTHTYGEKVDFSEVTAKKDGYKFVGWYYDVDLTKPADGNNLTVKAHYDAVNCIDGYDPVDLYPKFVKEEVCDENYDKTYKIHYEFELSEDQTVTYGENSILHVVYKDGYQFEGWYFDKELTEKLASLNSKDVDGKVKVNKDAKDCIEGYSDITLYPKFVKKANCIVMNGKAYYYDGDTIVKTIDFRSKVDNDTGKVYYYSEGEIVDTRTIGDEINLVDRLTFDPFEKKGYKFTGWFADKELTAKVTNAEELTSYLEKNTPAQVGTYIDEEGCIASNRDIELYAKYSLDNPETGDSIYIYIGLGILLVAASGLTIKKIMNK